MDRLASPACKHIVCMMMTRMFVMVVMVMIIAAAFAVIVVMVMIVLFMLMMMVFMLVMMVLMLVVMAAALTLFMVMTALRADDLVKKFFLKGFTGFHRLKNLFPRKLRDRSRDKRSLVIELPQQNNTLFDLLRFCLVCTA